jgi:hypothetical protein
VIHLPASVRVYLCLTACDMRKSFDGLDGFAVWAKRLEQGTYAMPFEESSERRREITAQELGALLSGIDLSQAKRRKRYRRNIAEAA